jgi:hypothetical protein
MCQGGHAVKIIGWGVDEQVPTKGYIIPDMILYIIYPFADSAVAVHRATPSTQAVYP